MKKRIFSLDCEIIKNIAHKLTFLRKKKLKYQGMIMRKFRKGKQW